jgi:adenine C2-methylase RlmN of 23S rRNA A2503 and tRNA A37
MALIVLALRSLWNRRMTAALTISAIAVHDRQQNRSVPMNAKSPLRTAHPAGSPCCF